MQLRDCSRRQAEQFIEAGYVSVDGQVVHEPQHRVLHEVVTVDPNASVLALQPLTYILNKVAGQVPTLSGRLSKLASCVPLENAASGLVVFTQDWRIERKLTEHMAEMEHELMADVQGEVPPQALEQIQRLLQDDRQRLPMAKVSLSSAKPTHSTLRFAVKGAHPGLVAYLCDQASLELVALRRIRLGRVVLGDLAAGAWRNLGEFERF
jgi:23S rRNA pseudouridine2604 synthase